MPVKPGKIDWDSIPEQQNSPTSTGIDWDSIPDTSNNTTITAREGGTVGNWLADAEDDIRHGGTKTLPGKVLHTMGATGLNEGSQAKVGDIMGGPIIGPVEAAHGISQIPSHPVSGLNELIKGAGHTLALPVAATQPDLLPTLATYGPIQTGITKGAEFLGAEPDTSELIGNVATLGAGHGLEKGGELASKFSEPLGKTAGIVGGAAEAIKHRNPTWLLTATPYGTKTATNLIDTGGKVAQSVGETIKPEIKNPFTSSGSEPVDEFGQQAEPLQLGKGAIITPPPKTETSTNSPVTTAVVRGSKGRMTKQFRFGTPETSNQNIIFGNEPATLPKLGEAKEPPRVIDGKLIENPVQENIVSENQPIVNTSTDDRDIQDLMRNQLENDEQSANDFSIRRMYAGHKPGYETEIPGEEGNTDLFPWARHPYSLQERK